MRRPAPVAPSPPHVRERCAALGMPYSYAYADMFDRLLIPPLKS
jgi:hypothetical protein